MRAKKSEYGVITTLVSLLLAGIFSLGTLTIESGRIQAAKTQLTDANISAGSSMIASYNSNLYSRYGLLAISNEAATEGRYREYLDFNSDLASGHKGNNLSTLYTIKTTELDSYYSLANPSVLKRQILTRAKHHIIPQDYALNYYNVDLFLSGTKEKAQYVMDILAPAANGTASAGTLNDVPVATQQALASLNTVFTQQLENAYDRNCDVTLSNASTALLPSVIGPETEKLPAEDLELINSAINDAQTVLGADGAMLASGGTNAYTEVDVTVSIDEISGIISLAKTETLETNAKEIAKKAQKVVQGVNAALNVLEADKEGNLLLNSYIAGYFSNRKDMAEDYSGPIKGTPVNGTMENATFSGACAEYIFAGNADEKENQKEAYQYIMAIRLVNNLYSVFTGSNFINQNNTCVVAAHIAWACYESCVDAELLSKYNVSVPLNKYSMILPINDPARAGSAFSSATEEGFLNGVRALGIYDGTNFVVAGMDPMTYKDSIATALWLVPNSQKMLRIADLIQLEMRYREQHIDKKTATFLMNNQNTFCRVKCEAVFNPALPVISLDADLEMDGIVFQNIKYVGY